MANAEAFGRADRDSAASTTQSDLAAMATDRAAGIRRALSHSEHVERYNEAVNAANDGEGEAAASILERLLSDLPDGELRLSAERLLQQLRDGPSSGR